MEKVMRKTKKENGKNKIPVLRLEVDYELTTLHDAMIKEDLEEMQLAKQRLELLRKEMVTYGAYTSPV